LGTIDKGWENLTNYFTSINIDIGPVYIDTPMDILKDYDEIINSKRDIFKKIKYVKRLLFE
jgi:hypothetical protein